MKEVLKSLVRVGGYEWFNLCIQWEDEEEILTKYASKMEYKVRSLKLEELDKLLSYDKN